MISKHFYWKSIIDQYIEKRKAIIFITVVLTVGLGVLGYLRSNTTILLSDEQKKEIKVYEDQLAAYDTQIEEAQKNYAAVEQEVANLQAYADNSLYMKLDGNNVPTASAQYAVTGTENVGNVLSGLLNWLQNGSLQQLMIQEYGETEAAHLRELIASWTLEGNLMTIRVYHTDMEQAGKLLEFVKKGMEAYAPELKKVQGAFILTHVATSQYSQVDEGLINGQNDKWNNLNNYRNSLTDNENKIVSLRASQVQYEKDSKPEVLEEAPPGKKLIIIYAVFGMVLGLVLPFAIFTFGYLLSDRIRSGRELARSSMTVFTTFRDGKSYHPALEQAVFDLEILAEHCQTGDICFNLLCSDEKVQQVTQEITEALQKEEIVVSVRRTAEEEDTDALRRMVGTGHCVLVVAARKNTYPQLKEQLALCRKFQVQVWGCIVVE